MQAVFEWRDMNQGVMSYFFFIIESSVRDFTNSRKITLLKTETLKNLQLT